MKSSEKYVKIDQLFIDEIYSQTIEWNRLGKALDRVNIDINFSCNFHVTPSPFQDCIETHFKEISVKDLYFPIKNIYFPEEVGYYPHCTIPSFFDELKIQLREFSQNVEKARIRNLQTRRVLTHINSELRKYEATGDQKHLLRAANVFLQFKKIQNEALNYNKRQLRHFIRCLFSRICRDLRQVLRTLIRFIFKNMDADNDDIEVLFKNKSKQIFFINKIYRLYEYTGNNSIFEYFDRNRSKSNYTNKGRAVRNYRKVKQSPFPGRMVSAHFTTCVAFGN